jgi:hypothetical protein
LNEIQWGYRVCIIDSFKVHLSRKLTIIVQDNREHDSFLCTNCRGTHPSNESAPGEFSFHKPPNQVDANKSNMANYDLALLPVRSGEQVYEWLGAPEEERRGWDLASAINLARMPGNLDRLTREWYENVLAVYMRGFPNDPDFWHAVCSKQYEFSIDRVLFPCFPDWVKDDHVLWLELLCHSSKNTHLVAHTGPTLQTSRPFLEALLQR